MLFKEIKQRAVQAALGGNYRHEYHTGLESSNRLASGDISAPQLAALLRRSDAADYSCRPHPADRSVQLRHIDVGGWAIEFYFLDDNTVYTGVHKHA